MYQSQKSLVGSAVRIVLLGLFTIICAFAFINPPTWMSGRPEAEVVLTLFSVSTTALIYEAVLRQAFLKEVNAISSKQLIEYTEHNKQTFEKETSKLNLLLSEKLNEVIKENMPGHYKRFREAGLIDVYKNFYMGNIEQKILDAGHQTIRISSNWLPFIRDLQVSRIADLVLNHNCKYQILLCHPNNATAIMARAKQLKKTHETLLEDICSSILVLHEVYSKVKDVDENLAKNIELRLSKSFLTTPLISFGESTILVGFYLSRESWLFNPVLKICEPGRDVYDRFHKHMDDEWNDIELTQLTSNERLIIDLSDEEFIKKIKQIRNGEQTSA